MHYENFPVVTWLLPRELHQHFFNLYAWCRWADDLGDETGDPGRSLELLMWWREQLSDCYAGKPRHPVLIALRETIDRYAVPSGPFERLISAFEQDQRVTEYATFADLHDYCTRSANPVGELVLHLLESCTADNLRFSDSICTGLQLANFWQDVARDFDIGRVYVPREDCARFDYSDALLRQRVTNAAFVAMMRFEVDRAESFLRGGLPLADRLPGRFAFDVDLFARGGLRILDRIRRIEYRVWNVRPRLTRLDSGRLLGAAMVRAARRAIVSGRTTGAR